MKTKFIVSLVAVFAYGVLAEVLTNQSYFYYNRKLEI